MYYILNYVYIYIYKNCSEDGIIHFRMVAVEGGGSGKYVQRRWLDSILKAKRTFLNHIEYEDHSRQKESTCPVKTRVIFFFNLIVRDG